MSHATFTHVCRHDGKSKISPAACELRRHKAAHPDRLPYDQQYRLEPCRGCEGPVPLEEPEHVKTQGPAPRAKRERRGAAPTGPARPAKVPDAAAGEAGAHHEDPRESAGVPGVSPSGRPAPSGQPGQERGPAGGGPTVPVQSAKAPTCPICNKRPQKKLNGQEGKYTGTCEPCMRKALDGQAEPGVKRKISAKRQRSMALVRLILDRNNKLKAAVHKNKADMALFAAQDVVDLVEIWALNEGH